MTTDKKIEIIRYFENRAAGFTIEMFNETEIISFHEVMSCPLGGLFFDVALGPLFLQRAIEGVNREACKRDDDYTYIDIQSDCIDYCSGPKDWNQNEERSHRIFIEKMDIDDAKIAALEWIMEKEKES